MSKKQCNMELVMHGLMHIMNVNAQGGVLYMWLILLPFNLNAQMHVVFHMYGLGELWGGGIGPLAGHRKRKGSRIKYYNIIIYYNIIK
jgi:hypothetical protein